MKEHGKQLAGILIAWAFSATALHAQFPTSGMVLRLTSGAGVEEAIGDGAENGDPVVRWLDQSGLGNHVSTNGFAGSQTPTYLTGVLNGEPVVNYDNANDRLQATTPLLTGTTDFSIFAVIRTSGASERYIGGNFGVGNLGGLEFYVSGLDKLNLYNNGFLTGATTLQDNVWYLVHAEKSGSSYTLLVNNLVDATGSLGGSLSGSLNWTVGNSPDYQAFLAGDMAEQIVYNRALTTDERNQVAHRLADNFGLSIPEPGVIALVGVGVIWLLRGRRR